MFLCLWARRQPVLSSPFCPRNRAKKKKKTNIKMLKQGTFPLWMNCFTISYLLGAREEFRLSAHMHTHRGVVWAMAFPAPTTPVSQPAFIGIGSSPLLHLLPSLVLTQPLP